MPSICKFKCLHLKNRRNWQDIKELYWGHHAITPVLSTLDLFGIILVSFSPWWGKRNKNNPQKVKCGQDRSILLYYNCLYGISPIDVNNFVNFIPHIRTRNCFNPEILLKTPSCKTSSFKASYFNRITKLWNIMCKVAPPSSLGTLSSFKNFVTNYYFNLLANVFDIDQPCTWSAFLDCSCHRTHSHWFITL